MSKIIMKRSELENLIENMLLDGLIVEGSDIDDDKDPDADIDDSLLDDDDELSDTDEDEALVPAKTSSGGSIKRVASAIADKVSKAYDTTKDVAGKIYDKLPDAKDVKEKFVDFKDTARDLSNTYGSGILGAAIDVGDSVYDLGDVTYKTSKAGMQKLAAVGQDETDIKLYVTRLARMSDRALDNQTIASEEGVEGAENSNISPWFETTTLGDLLMNDTEFSVAGGDPANDSSRCFYMHYFGYTIQALKDTYFAIDRMKQVPELGHYGIGKYMSLRGKPKTYFQNQIINAINRDLSQLARETNEFHEKVREDLSDLENFIDALGDLMHSGDAAFAPMSTIEANIKDVGSSNLEPYVFQVYNMISNMLERSIYVIETLVDATNKGFGGRRPRQFRREGKSFPKDEYESLYHMLEPDKITKSIEKFADIYEDLSNNKVTGKTKRYLKDTAKGGAELGLELGKIAAKIMDPTGGKRS
jgi:hypothetical protein